MQSNKDLIQAKKAKLEEFRRRKEEREKEFAAGRQSVGSQRIPSPTNAADSRQEIDSLVSSLIGDPSPAVRHDAAPVRYPSRINHTFIEAAQPQQAEKPDAVPRSRVSLSIIPAKTIYEVKAPHTVSKPKATLSMEPESYSKGVQTMDWDSSSVSSSLSDSDTDLKTSRERPKMRKLSRRQLEREERTKERLRKEIEKEFRQSQKAATEMSTPSTELKPPAAVPLPTTQGLDGITVSLDFLDFLDRSGKVMERALEEDYDVLADYRLGMINDDEDDATGRNKRGTRLKEIAQFYDEKWSKKRMITDLHFSQKFPELVLASYTKNSSAPNDPDGLVQVWNLHMPSRSEYLHHATSDILTAKFHPFHPNLILGGAYSGQVYLWDTRSRSPSPVQTTPPTGAGHSHPIYSLAVTGTQNAHNIVTTSTDGIMCSWTTDMLGAAPQQKLLLRAPPSMMNPSVSSIIPNTRSPFANDLAVTSTAFPEAQTAYFLAATEQGPIHLCHRHDRAGIPAGVDTRVYYRAHAAPVMSLDFHNASGPHNLGDLMLSTGLDWSINLWRIKPPMGGFHDLDRGQVNTIAPILQIPRDDAVYDAKWSPARPAVFASVDGAGWLDVWDLNTDVEAPVSRARPAPRNNKFDANTRFNARSGIGGVHEPEAYGDLKTTMDGQGAGRSLNKCAWEPVEGRRIAVGGLDGGVTVFDVGSDLCGAASPKTEEWDGVKRLITRLEGAGL